MRHTVWFVAGAAVLLLGAATAGIALLDDSNGDGSTQSSSRTVGSAAAMPSTLPLGPSTSTVSPTVSTTAPPSASPSTVDDRLTSNSRLGFAGLGPIKLGMSHADVERMGDVTLRQTGCPLLMTPGPGSGLDPIPGPSGDTITGFSAWTTFPTTEPRTIDEIDILHPAIYTISGIHVGSTADDVRRTYTNVKEATLSQDSDQRFWRTLIIANPQGTAIEFIINSDGFVYSMSLGVNAEVFANHRLC